MNIEEYETVRKLEEIFGPGVQLSEVAELVDLGDDDDYAREGENIYAGEYYDYDL